MAEQKRKILLAEDDNSFGELLKNYLELNDFETHWFNNGIDAFKGFSKHYFDICLLDVMMPDMNGFQLAEEFKKIRTETSLLFLTAKSLKEDILTGYKCGADDYIIKPFDSELLIFKINAILKRTNNTLSNPKGTTEFVLGKYKLNTALLLLSSPAGDRQLSHKENELLKLFCLYKDNLLPRNIALKNIWGNDDYFSARSMDVYITKIRKYLKDDPSIELINIHGKGYRLNTNSIHAS